MTKVLLIDPSSISLYSNYTVKKDVYPHSGLLMLGTVLKKAGHDVKIVHMVADGITINNLPLLLGSYHPEIVAVTAVTFQLKQAKAVLAKVREILPRALTVIGGSHASASPEDFVDLTDMVVVGEGEWALTTLADNGFTMSKVLQGRYVRDLDSLPFIDLSLIDIKRFSGIYPPGRLPSIPLSFTRGCPFSCSFCSNSVFGTQVRYRNPENVIEEVDRMNRDHGIKEVFFMDDTLNCNPDYAKKAFSLIISRSLNKKMHFRARLRANEKLLDKELLDLMKRANFWCVFYGVESGNQQILDNAVGKNLTIEEIKRAFRMTRQAGIATEASFIIGMPGETESTIKDSISLWRELKSDWCSFNRAIPFPGTRFYEEVKTKGYLLYHDCEDYKLNATLVRTDEMGGDNLEWWACYCDRLVLRDKVKRLLMHPPEMYHVIKDTGLRRIGQKIVSMANG